MASDAPPAKRTKPYSSFPEYDDDSMDTDDGKSDTSSFSSFSFLSQSSNVAVGKVAGGNVGAAKPLVLQVPKKYMRVPHHFERTEHPSLALVSEKRKRRCLILKPQFDALERMPLNDICVFAGTSPEFKEIAEKFFAVKYRHIQLLSLADPVTGQFTLVKVQRMLKEFGHLIWSLTLNLHQLDNRDSCADLLDLINNHCSETLGWMVF